MFSVRSSVENKEAKSLKICEKVIKFSKEISAEKIFCYVAMGSEVDTKRIISYYINTSGYELYAPYTDGDMKLKRLLAEEPLIADKLGNLPPSSYADGFYDGGVDMVVVPMLAFNSDLFRLGYGGGYYDRFLSNSKAVSVGIAFDEQESELIEVEKHDIATDYLITPTRILRRTDER